MRKILRLLLAVLLSLSLVGLVAGPAFAGHKVGPYRYWLVDDDEQKGFTKNRGVLNYGVSKSFKTVTGYSWDTMPDGRPFRRETISCANMVIDKIRVNVGKIGNYNPPAQTKECKPGGVAFYIPIKPQVIWNSGKVDRCTGVRVTFIKARLSDVVRNYPSLCLPRG